MPLESQGIINVLRVCVCSQKIKKNGNNGIIIQKLQLLQCYIFTLCNILLLNFVISLNFTKIVFFLHRCFFYAQTASLLQYIPRAHRGLTLHSRATHRCNMSPYFMQLTSQTNDGTANKRFY